MIGRSISHYRILEKLGEGGMGVVYKAEDTKLDRFVALKFLPQHLSTGEDEKKRFINEAKAASALNHNNIGMIHEIDVTTDGQLFIVMAYYEGETLKDRIESHQAGLPTDEAIDIARQIAGGLAKAHSKDIIHRDIKPANILITEDGEVKIIDFGLAKLAGRTQLTKSGMTMGTVAYMSPEQAQGGTVGHRTDIWSLGIVFYEMLTGETPFKGEYEQAVIYSILNESPPPLADSSLDLPTELQDTLTAALAKKPEERYQSADEFVTDLQALAGEPQRSARTFRSLQGKRATKPLYVVAAVLVLMVAGWFIFRTQFAGTDSTDTRQQKSLAVMYFENRTGEADLDEMLVDMLTTNLARYDELEVVSSQRLFDLFRRIEREDVVTFDRSVATEIAKKARAKTMMLGSINMLGGKIRITTQISDVNSGRLIAAEQVEGRKLADVFDLVDLLTEKVVLALGIPGAIAGEQLQISDVTTNSYEAYRFYQSGLQSFWTFNQAEARRNFSRAVEFDSTFGMAYAKLALSSVGFSLWRFRPFANESQARQAMQKATKYYSRLTAKEQLFIDVYSTILFKRDYALADSFAATLVQNYPNDKFAALLLGINREARGRYSNAIRSFEKALELDPTFAGTYNALAYVYSRMGEHEKAISTVKKYRALQPEVYNTFDSALEIYVHAGHLNEAYEIFEEILRKWPHASYAYQQSCFIDMMNGNEARARIRLPKMLELIADDRPDSKKLATIRSQSDIGYSFVHEGRYADALPAFKKAVKIGQQLNPTRLGGPAENHPMVIEAYFDLGRCLMVQKKYAEARDAFAEAEKVSEDYFNPSFNPVRIMQLYYQGLTFVLQGNDSKAQTIAARIKAFIEENQYDLLYMQFYHGLQADRLVAQGSGKAAIAALEKIPHFVRRNVPRYWMLDADAQTLNGELDEAIKLYNGIYNRIFTTYQTGDPFSFFWERSKIDYKLARIYEQKGDDVKAIDHYKKAVEHWENADPGFLEVEDAKARLAKLTGMSQRQ